MMTPIYISSKRAILRYITNQLNQLIENENIDINKLPKFRWQDDNEANMYWQEVFANYASILNVLKNSGKYVGMSVPQSSDIIKKQQIYYANVILKFLKYFDLVISKYSSAKDIDEYLGRIEYDYNDFLYNVYSWAAIRGYQSINGKRGGQQDTKSQPILIAVKEFLKRNPKLMGKSDPLITKQFVLKHNKNNPLDINYKGCQFEVYCEEGRVWAIPSENNQQNIYKDVTKSVETLRKAYIPEAKKYFKKVGQ